MARISFTTMGTPAKDGFEAIAAARHYGYAGVDLRVHHLKGEIQVDSSDQHIADLKKCAEDNDISLPSLLCYNKGGSTEAGAWDAMHDDICHHMDIAQKIGAEGIRIFGGPLLDYTSPEAYIEAMSQVLQRVLDADDSGVRIVLQNHGGSYTFAQGIALTKQTDRPRFGMCFSPDHCKLMKEDWDYALANARQYSLQMYCSDVHWNADGSHAGALPGEGEVDLVAAFKAIGGANFDGWVSFKWEKIWQDALPEPEIALPHFVKYYNEKMLAPNDV